jgi:hypothetical protein
MNPTRLSDFFGIRVKLMHGCTALYPREVTSFTCGDVDEIWGTDNAIVVVWNGSEYLIPWSSIAEIKLDRTTQASLVRDFGSEPCTDPDEPTRTAEIAKADTVVAKKKRGRPRKSEK